MKQFIGVFLGLQLCTNLVNSVLVFRMANHFPRNRPITFDELDQIIYEMKYIIVPITAVLAVFATVTVYLMLMTNRLMREVVDHDVPFSNAKLISMLIIFHDFQ